MFGNRLSGKADEELMLMVQGGDERALSELYGRYSKKLIRYFYRMLWKEEERARDFLHDLFVKIIEKPDRFDANRKFSTWMYSVAFNMCKNEYRRRAMLARNEHATNGHVVSEVAQPDLDHREFQIKVDGILEQDENARNLFALRYELEMSMEEIAAALDCPEGTVKSRLFHLKKRLAEKLQAYNPALN